MFNLLDYLNYLLLKLLARKVLNYETYYNICFVAYVLLLFLKHKLTNIFYIKCIESLLICYLANTKS